MSLAGGDSTTDSSTWPAEDGVDWRATDRVTSGSRWVSKLARTCAMRSSRDGNGNPQTGQASESDRDDAEAEVEAEAKAEADDESLSRDKVRR